MSTYCPATKCLTPISVPETQGQNFLHTSLQVHKKSDRRVTRHLASQEIPSEPFSAEHQHFENGKVSAC